MTKKIMLGCVSFTQTECNEGMQGSSNHELIQAIFPNEIVFAQGKKKYFNRNTFENYEQKTVFHDFNVCVPAYYI